MILVTGAGGKTGQAIIKALKAVGRPAPIRAFVYRQAHAAQAEAAGAQTVIVGDMRDPQAYSAAVLGAEAVYHICPNVNPDEVAIGMIAIKAARDAGVAHFVYHSVLHPQIEAMPHHWLKLRVEEALIASGLLYTILQPASYMQNILGSWQEIHEEGTFAVPYSINAQIGMVDLEDVARVAASVVMHPGHTGATYELVGLEELTPAGMAGILGAVLGRPVAARQVSVESWVENARRAGLGQYQIDTLSAMFRYYDAYGLSGNPNALGYLMGRAPTTFREFVERIVSHPAQS